MSNIKPGIQIEKIGAKGTETGIASHRPESQDSIQKKQQQLMGGSKIKHTSPSPDDRAHANDASVAQSTFSMGYYTLGAGSLKSTNIIKRGPQAGLSFG